MALVTSGLGCGPVVPAGETTAAETSTASATVGVTSEPDPSTTTSTAVTTSASPAVTSNDTTSTTDAETSSSTTTRDIQGGGSIECSVWDQNCLDGQKCVPWNNDGGTTPSATRCIDLHPDPASSGEPCSMEDSPGSGVDDCDATSVCFFVDHETLAGICTPMCSGDEDNPICPQPLSCHISNEGVIALCLVECDPLALDCGAGRVCTAGSNETFHCFPAGEVLAVGTECNAFDLCVDGAACVPADRLAFACDGESCCTPLCNLTDLDPDLACPNQPTGEVCSSFWGDEPAQPGLEHVGVCRSP